MNCINLKQRFGKPFKVVYEESYYAQYGGNARTEDPWLMILLCQHGHIYPYGGTKLAVSTDKAGAVAKRIKALPFAEVVQDGDDGANVVFDVSHFEEVARIMKPRRRRRLSPKQRHRNAERLAKYAFRPARQCPNSRRPCVSTGQGD